MFGGLADFARRRGKGLGELWQMVSAERDLEERLREATREKERKPNENPYGGNSCEGGEEWEKKKGESDQKGGKNPTRGVKPEKTEETEAMCPRGKWAVLEPK